MVDWGSGYVTDTAYIHDFCRAQTPAVLSLAALAKNVAAHHRAPSPPRSRRTYSSRTALKSRR
jgi:hypothetical protein